MNELQALLDEIAHCPIATCIRSGQCTSSPCEKIVRLQSFADFQIPEPWSGQIDYAPILFLSSNPSIDERELYPDESWDSSRISDFFQHRFTSSEGWVDAKLRALRRDGTRTQWIRFWASARCRASEILQKNPADILAGSDFALTEIVHCKSRNEEGVKEAQDYCSKLYLQRILSISAAKVLIVYGARAAQEIQRRFASVMEEISLNLNTVSIDGKSRLVTFLPHPNERGSEKTLRANIGEVGLAMIRTRLDR